MSRDSPADDRFVAEAERWGEVVGCVRQPGLCEMVPGGEVMWEAIDDHAIEVKEDGEITPHAT